MKQVIVTEGAAEKLKGRFPWVYDNEILRRPKDTSAGEIIEVRSPAGMFLGIGYINIMSVITVRILSFAEEPIDREFFFRKIQKADRLRIAVKERSNAYRVVHAEADELPGLVVDSYNGYLAVQINTAGMEVWRGTIIATLRDCLGPRGIYEKSDRQAREKEGLTTEDGTLAGYTPDRVCIEEGNASFEVRLQESQKTGFYLDQRRNRGIVASYVQRGFQVLDVFSNTGGFGICAALKGAGSVRLVDISQAALDSAVNNAALNRLAGVEFVKADAFDYLQDEVSTRNKYDIIVLDPPSFTKTNRAKRGAIRGFKHLVSQGLCLLNPNGHLAVFSCSHHITMDDLKAVAAETAFNAGVRLRVLEHLFQDADHPYLINIPQSLYLKGLLLQKD